MNEIRTNEFSETAPDPGVTALCKIAAFYRIGADPRQLTRQLGISGRAAAADDLVRGAKMIGLKARVVEKPAEDRLRKMPTPALLGAKAGGFLLLGGIDAAGKFRLLDVRDLSTQLLDYKELVEVWDAVVVLVSRRANVGIDPKKFGVAWFLPSLWRYRRPIAQVLFASLFVQLFALVTPLFFQIVVDKVLVHKGTSTLIVVTSGMIALGFFNVVLQYLRAYILSHTTNRIDVELGARLFHHLLRLPLSYFETRAAGQTVARVRELETIRSFLTGQALFSVLDTVFAIVFVFVLLAYSPFLTLIVLAACPVYVVIALLIRPLLRERVNQKFNRGAMSQQFLVETVIGMQTVKAAAIEPVMQSNWEERLAAYVKTSFDVTVLASLGQNATQFVSTLTTALVIFFGAQLVINGTLTVGELVAFNMIANQISQPILRLSQLFQDFQQVKISIDRLGDILNAQVEPAPLNSQILPPAKGMIEFKGVDFRYVAGAPPALSGVSLKINAGEVIGLIGPSGSGKSTLTKLMQRLYTPERGQILLDGLDIAQMDPAWLRRQIGVVLQENLLFNRTVHENIALADPAMPRSHVIQMAHLSGAHEFIAQMPQGYDTVIEERGVNLSGGQRQRIAIARALSTNPRILIFDEATSALDYESERIVQANMREIVKGRTVIIIAHRLAAVRQCNRIFGLFQGRVVEQGSHDELLKRDKGLYAHLWSLQAGQSGGATP